MKNQKKRLEKEEEEEEEGRRFDSTTMFALIDMSDRGHS